MSCLKNALPPLLPSLLLSPSLSASLCVHCISSTGCLVCMPRHTTTQFLTWCAYRAPHSHVSILLGLQRRLIRLKARQAPVSLLPARSSLPLPSDPSHRQACKPSWMQSMPTSHPPPVVATQRHSRCVDLWWCLHGSSNRMQAVLDMC